MQDSDLFTHFFSNRSNYRRFLIPGVFFDPVQQHIPSCEVQDLVVPTNPRYGHPSQGSSHTPIDLCNRHIYTRTFEVDRLSWLPN